MRKHTRRGAALIFAGILIAGWIPWIGAEDRKEIPDHSDFQSCQACHAEKHDMWAASGHGKAIGQIVHTGASTADCSGCHSPRRAEFEPIADNADKGSFHQTPCLACHSRQKTEFPRRTVRDPEKLCDICHAQRPIFLGMGAKGIEDIRNFHSGVPCVSCHMTEGNHRMKVLRPDDPGLSEKRLDTCTACHQDNNREARVRQLHEYQSTYEESMAPLLADVKAIEAKIGKKPNLLKPALKTKFENVKSNLSLLQNDGSRGFHNFIFSLEVASLAAADLKEIKAAVK